MQYSVARLLTMVQADPSLLLPVLSSTFREFVLRSPPSTYSIYTAQDYREATTYQRIEGLLEGAGGEGLVKKFTVEKTSTATQTSRKSEGLLEGAKDWSNEHRTSQDSQLKEPSSGA